MLRSLDDPFAEVLRGVFARRLRLCRHYNGKVPELNNPHWRRCDMGLLVEVSVFPAEYAPCEGLEPGACHEYAPMDLFTIVDGVPVLTALIASKG